MKLQLPKEYRKTWGSPPPISYKTDPTLDKTPTDNLDYLKVDIKNQPGQRDIERVVIYMPMFWTVSTEDLLKFVILLNKIIQGQDLSMIPKKFGMTRYLLIR